MNIAIFSLCSTRPQKKNTHTQNAQSIHLYKNVQEKKKTAGKRNEKKNKNLNL